MELTSQPLGKYIEILDNRNIDNSFGIEDVRGINNQKKFMSTKADLTNRDLTKFQIVNPGEFVFNHRTSRNGSKFSIAYNDEARPVICTEDYVVFRIKKECIKTLNPIWLYLYLNRSEFDRFVITSSWGSSTEFYNYSDLCEVKIELPPIDIQQKYVNIYKAMVDNQKAYENGLDDLKLTLDSLLDTYKKRAKRKRIGDLLSEVDQRNSDGKVNNLKGINISKQFMDSVANTTGIDFKKYKIVNSNQIAFSGMQTGRDECIRIALSDSQEPIIISPAYTVFKVKTEQVEPEYIMMWFKRKESDRYGWFLSDSSIRSNLDLNRFLDIELPIPSAKEQQALVQIYSAYSIRSQLNERLKDQIKNICPILIKGSIEEARKA